MEKYGEYGESGKTPNKIVSPPQTLAQERVSIFN